MHFKETVVIAALLISACNQTDGVYAMPLPKSDDVDALNDIKDNLRPEDAEAWQRITMQIVMPIAERPVSKTVGEAIKNYKARKACQEKNDLGKVKSPEWAGNDDTARYNKAVDAYNKEIEAVKAAFEACPRI